MPTKCVRDYPRPLRCHLLLAILLASLAGCATTRTTTQIDRLERGGEEPRILLMTPDIQYDMVTASGLKEPNAEWTQAARTNFLNATVAFAERHNTDFVVMGDAGDSNELVRRYEKLYQAVGFTVLNNYVLGTRLPSKGDRFDWSLGSGVGEIGEPYGADYALFVYYRDEQATGGRVAMYVLGSALGVSVPLGAEYGYASLIDMRTGDVVWFNTVMVGSGELRNASGATAMVNTLFKDLPAG